MSENNRITRKETQREWLGRRLRLGNFYFNEQTLDRLTAIARTGYKPKGTKG